MVTYYSDHPSKENKYIANSMTSDIEGLFLKIQNIAHATCSIETGTKSVSCVPGESKDFRDGERQRAAIDRGPQSITTKDLSGRPPLFEQEAHSYSFLSKP